MTNRPPPVAAPPIAGFSGGDPMRAVQGMQRANVNYAPPPSKYPRLDIANKQPVSAPDRFRVIDSYAASGQPLLNPAWYPNAPQPSVPQPSAYQPPSASEPTPIQKAMTEGSSTIADRISALGGKPAITAQPTGTLSSVTPERKAASTSALQGLMNPAPAPTSAPTAAPRQLNTNPLLGASPTSLAIANPADPNKAVKYMRGL